MTRVLKCFGWRPLLLGFLLCISSNGYKKVYGLVSHFSCRFLLISAVGNSRSWSLQVASWKPMCYNLLYNACYQKSKILVPWTFFMPKIPFLICCSMCKMFSTLITWTWHSFCLIYLHYCSTCLSFKLFFCRFELKETGEYLFCFDNSFSRMAQKVIKLKYLIASGHNYWNLENQFWSFQLCYHKMQSCVHKKCCRHIFLFMHELLSPACKKREKEMWHRINFIF